MPVIWSSGVSTFQGLLKYLGKYKDSQESGSVSYTVDMSTIEGFY